MVGRSCAEQAASFVCCVFVRWLLVWLPCRAQWRPLPGRTTTQVSAAPPAALLASRAPRCPLLSLLRPAASLTCPVCRRLPLRCAPPPRRKAGVANIREYEETHLKESQRLVKERRDLAGQVGGWTSVSAGRMGWLLGGWLSRSAWGGGCQPGANASRRPWY